MCLDTVEISYAGQHASIAIIGSVRSGMGNIYKVYIISTAF